VSRYLWRQIVAILMLVGTVAIGRTLGTKHRQTPNKFMQTSYQYVARLAITCR
jgi:hypothetical protein